MPPRPSAPLLALLAVACTGKDTPVDSELPPIRGDETAAPCLGHAPVAVALELGNGGVTDFDGTPYPTILFNVLATDEDGNLNYVTLDIWFQAGGEGDFTPSGDPQVSSAMSTGADDCGQSEAELKLKVQVGEGLDYNTAYDFGVRVTDQAAEVSNILTGVGITPRADGSDGDGSGS